MVTSGQKNALNAYAFYLAEHNFLSETIALQAFSDSIKEKISFIQYMIKYKILDDANVARSAAEYFGLPLCDIQAVVTDAIPKEYLNLELVKKHLAIPLFKKSSVLFLAITDPTIENLFEVKFLTGLDTRLLIVEANKMEVLINELLNTKLLSEIDVSMQSNETEVEVSIYAEDNTDLATFDIDSAPVVNYVNKILLDAIEKKASDIHFEHFENNYRIRFRQNGILNPITPPPLKIANYILARIKVMADLDITEHRIPQDGRFKLTISRKRSVDFRVSICPTLFGEKVVLRILDVKNTIQDASKIGMDAKQTTDFNLALQSSQGMILVTGPTGSGKTVTLYSALHKLNSIEKNISTVEDPVEIPVLGINQVNVNVKTGLTFASALRAFLRQDPDIIMVGEIRDLETAEIAVKAAQTGHLVLSTLHTNSAAETITRLMSMGIPPYNLASSLKLIIAQRLVRVLCEHCKQPDNIEAQALLAEGFTEAEIKDMHLFKPEGCDHCTNGFSGRIGIFEVLPISLAMAEIIMKQGTYLDILKQAKVENIISLHDSGLSKVKQGITTLAELNRVFK